jgi:hypothetical protein
MIKPGQIYKLGTNYILIVKEEGLLKNVLLTTSDLASMEPFDIGGCSGALLKQYLSDKQPLCTLDNLPEVLINELGSPSYT